MGPWAGFYTLQWGYLCHFTTTKPSPAAMTITMELDMWN